MKLFSLKMNKNPPEIPTPKQHFVMYLKSRTNNTSHTNVDGKQGLFRRQFTFICDFKSLYYLVLSHHKSKYIKQQWKFNRYFTIKKRLKKNDFSFFIFPTFFVFLIYKVNLKHTIFPFYLWHWCKINYF